MRECILISFYRRKKSRFFIGHPSRFFSGALGLVFVYINVISLQVLVLLGSTLVTDLCSTEPNKFTELGTVARRPLCQTNLPSCVAWQPLSQTNLPRCVARWPLWKKHLLLKFGSFWNFIFYVFYHKIFTVLTLQACIWNF
mgnify:CR=1 FL=1